MILIFSLIMEGKIPILHFMFVHASYVYLCDQNTNTELFYLYFPRI